MSHLMTPADLEAVTGFTRYSKQADWLKRNFNVDAPRRADGSVVMTWATYEALAASKAGIGTGGVPVPRVELCFD
jgi:hypothetical protein